MIIGTSIGAPTFNKQPDRTELTPIYYWGVALAFGLIAVVVMNGSRRRTRSGRWRK